MLKRAIHPNNWQKTRGIYSPGIEVDFGSAKMLFISGQQAKKNEKHEVFSDNIEEQTEDVFERINEILKTAGYSMENVVKAVIYLTDFENDFKKVSAIRDRWFIESKPVSTCVGATEFSRKGAKIEVEITAIKGKEKV